MEKTTENKLARNVETKKITAANCPEKGSHPARLGRVCPACGQMIPIGQVYSDSEFRRLFDVDTSASVGPDAFAKEEARLWTEYEAADAERARIAGEVLRADSELVGLKAQASEADYKHGTGDPVDAAAASRKITQNGERRVQLAEALEEARARERVIQLKITKAGQRREAERRRLEAAAGERPGLVERVQRAFR